MKMILFAFLIAAAFAEKAPTESKPLELPDFSNLQQPASGPKEGLSFSADMNCKTNDGQSFKSNEAGFDTCVATQKGKQQ